MTVHVELMLTCDLNYDVPEEVVETLKYLTRKEDYEFQTAPSHPFFDETLGGWRYIFQSSEYHKPSDMNYFPGVGVILFQHTSWDENLYKLTIHCEIGTIHEFVELYFPFLQWLAQYVNTEETGEFVGYFQRTNIGTDKPTLIYFRNNKVYFSEAVDNLVEANEEIY